MVKIMWPVCMLSQGLRMYFSQFQVVDHGSKHELTRRMICFIRGLDVVCSSDLGHAWVYVYLPSQTYWEVHLTADNITSL